MPQVRGMYAGDHARKKNLIDYGFRLPSAFDNRPLNFDEFYDRINQVVFVSATPGDLELEKSQTIAEQIIRPTGLLDPEISVRPTEGQLDDLVSEINIRVSKKQRVLITTLTKKMAEDLTAYLETMGIKVRYMHHDIDTVERMEIVRDLRLANLMCLSESTFCEKVLIFRKYRWLPCLTPTKRVFCAVSVHLSRFAVVPHETARAL